MEEETNKEVETITENTTSVTGTQSENANNAENNPKVDKKATLYTIKVLLFLLICCFIGAALIKGTDLLVKRNRVFWSRHLTDSIEVVRYRNDDYQLRRSDNHKRISKRYRSFDNQYMKKDSIIILGKNGEYVLFSLKSNCFCGDEVFSYRKIYQPDSAGYVAVIDDQNMLKFLRLHGCGCRMPGIYPIDEEVEYRYDICFEGEYCVLPHRDRGICLINRSGHFLLDGFEDIKLIDSHYILTKDWDGKETLFGAHTLDTLLSGKTAIYVSPAGIHFYEGGRCYLMDSTASTMVADMVLDVMDCQYSPGVETLYEPDEETPSSYKAFYMNDYIGVFDRDYHVIIEPKWEDVQYLGNGYFLCIFDGQAIIMNKEGEVVRR